MFFSPVFEKLKQQIHSDNLGVKTLGKGTEEKFQKLKSLDVSTYSKFINNLGGLSLREVLKNCIQVISDPKEYPSISQGRGTCLNVVRQNTQSLLKRSYTIANTMNKVKKRFTIKDIIIDELAEYTCEDKHHSCSVHKGVDFGMKSEDLQKRLKSKGNL